MLLCRPQAHVHDNSSVAGTRTHDGTTLIPRTTYARAPARIPCPTHPLSRTGSPFTTERKEEGAPHPGREGGEEGEEGSQTRSGSEHKTDQ